MTEVANNFARSLRTRISVKINKLPLSYFDRHQSGDTLSRVTNDVDTIAQTMNQSLGTLVSNITLFLGSIIMMFYTNWIMALTAILSSLLGFMGMFAVLSKSQKYFVAKQEELGNLNGHIEEVYSGLNVVKAYNGKKESDKKFDEYNQKVCEANRKSQFLSGIMQPIMNFIGNFGYVAVCIVGALLTMNNIISFGVIIAFITYVRLFTNPLSQIAQSMTSLQSTAAASERVFEFLDEKEMADQSKINKTLDKNNVKGKIEFDNVVFQYDNNDKPTIKNFTATAEPGQKIAIVGKYIKLEDSYLSVVESIKHAGYANEVDVEIGFVDSETINAENAKEKLEKFDGIIVPGGFGNRGIEGKIQTVKYARENNVPFLGICLGMQMAVIEFARDVLDLKDADSVEFNPDTKNPVIHIMEDQKNITKKGGTMRLGAYPCVLEKGTLASNLYGSEEISERHRHRYEFNNDYKKKMEEKKMVFSGTSPDGNLVEIVEIKNHPYFIAVQFHPEFKSRPDRPQPLFVGLVKATKNRI